MQPRIILLSCFVCWIVLLAQGGEGLFFTDGGASGALVFGGSTAAGGANAAVLLGGLVVAKAVGLGVLALLLVRFNIVALQILTKFCNICMKLRDKK